MKEILNAGIIGCGMIGRGKHAGTITAQPDMKLKALCDIVPEKARGLALERGLKDVDIYEDYREMLQDESLDIIYVCTPNPLHCEMAVAALEAGKHVFVEKPLACTKAECDQIIAAAKKQNKKVSVGFQRRYFPAHQMAKSVVESGELGDIYYAVSHSIRYRGTPGWGEYLTGKNGGGVFIDGVPHSLDLTLWLMNNYEPKSVKANLYYEEMKMAMEGNMWGSTWKEENFKVETSGFALVTMKNGATIYMECAWAINFLSSDMKTTLCGTKAGLDMQGGPATTDYLRLNGVRHGGEFVETLTPVVPIMGGIRDANLDANLQENRNFINAIRTGEDPLVTPEQAAVVTQIIEGIYLSAQSGKEIQFA